jgi:hypothetical protein
MSAQEPKPKKKRPRRLNFLAFSLVEQAAQDQPAAFEKEQERNNPAAVALGQVDATAVDPDAPGQNLIPDVSEHIIKGGVELSVPLTADIKLLADVYYQYVGGAPFYDYWDITMPPPHSMP